MATDKGSLDIDWTATVQNLGPGLLAYFQALFPRQIAAELVQEVLLRLVVKVRDGKFQPTVGTLRMYAFGIARLVRLEGRRAEPPASMEFVDDHMRGEQSKMPHDDSMSLRTAITRLKAAEQEIILLLLDRDLSLAAIAELMKMPVGSVKSHVHRAKESLRVLLAEATREN